MDPNEIVLGRIERPWSEGTGDFREFADHLERTFEEDGVEVDILDVGVDFDPDVEFAIIEGPAIFVYCLKLAMN